MSNSLKNKVIVITRSKEQAGDSIQKLESLGAKVIPFPTIKIVHAKDYTDFDSAAEKLSEFDYIIFTSANAVKYTLERLDKLNLTVPRKIKIAAVGKKTADVCEKNNIEVHIIPNDFSAEGLINYFSDKNVDGKRFFIPCSAIARNELEEGLKKQNAFVEKVPVYDIAIPDKDELLPSLNLMEQYKPQLFIFTSPSTYENFIVINDIENPKEYFRDYDIAAIGPVTAQAIEASGVSVDIVPANYTMDSLITAIEKFYEQEKTIET